jgi:hypothetical protein
MAVVTSDQSAEDTGVSVDETEEDDEAPLQRSTAGTGQPLSVTMPEVPLTESQRNILASCRNTFIHGVPEDDDGPLVRAQTDNTAQRRDFPGLRAPGLGDIPTTLDIEFSESAAKLVLQKGSQELAEENRRMEEENRRIQVELDAQKVNRYKKEQISLDDSIQDRQITPDVSPLGQASGYGFPGGNPGMLPPYMPWPWSPYMMPGMMPPYPMMSAPELGSGPPFGILHRFHPECHQTMGVCPDLRWFTKQGFEGRLSTVTEDKVHTSSEGLLRYVVQFVGGEMSPADGVGFVFSNKLPCPKNIQKIVSIFVNAAGRICVRVYEEMIKVPEKVAWLKQLELGDWVELAIDLDAKTVTFHVWACHTYEHRAEAHVDYGKHIEKYPKHSKVDLSQGYLACVVKNQHVTLVLGS